MVADVQEDGGRQHNEQCVAVDRAGRDGNGRQGNRSLSGKADGVDHTGTPGHTVAQRIGLAVEQVGGAVAGKTVGLGHRTGERSTDRKDRGRVQTHDGGEHDDHRGDDQFRADRGLDAAAHDLEQLLVAAACAQAADRTEQEHAQHTDLQHARKAGLDDAAEGAVEHVALVGDGEQRVFHIAVGADGDELEQAAGNADDAAGNTAEDRRDDDVAGLHRDDDRQNDRNKHQEREGIVLKLAGIGFHTALGHGADDKDRDDRNNGRHGGILEAGAHDAGNIHALRGRGADGGVGHGSEVVAKGCAGDDNAAQQRTVAAEREARGVHNAHTGGDRAEARAGRGGEQRAGEERDDEEHRLPNAEVGRGASDRVSQTGGAQDAGEHTGEEPADDGDDGIRAGNAVDHDVRIDFLILCEEQRDADCEERGEPESTVRNGADEEGGIDDTDQKQPQRQE